MSIHHIDYNKLNNDEDNLISLCRKCHLKTNKKINRNYYYKYFKEKIKNEFSFISRFFYNKTGLNKQSLLTEMLDSKDSYINETPLSRATLREVTNDPAETKRCPSEKEDDIVRAA